MKKNTVGFNVLKQYLLGNKFQEYPIYHLLLHNCSVINLISYIINNLQKIMYDKVFTFYGNSRQGENNSLVYNYPGVDKVTFLNLKLGLPYFWEV